MKYYTWFENPIKPLLLVSDGQALTGLYFETHRHGEEIQPGWQKADAAAPFPEAKKQLASYFAGERQTFELPLSLQGTAFQRQVWEMLLGIPYGTTVSYRTLAERVNRPESVRAVGGANARNPISIIIPCHRVIGSDGSLTGYGGGLEVKAALLAFERRVLAQDAQAFEK